MPLTRDQILNADDRPTLTIDVPEWGGEVILATHDGSLRAKYEAAMRNGGDGPGRDKLRAVVVSMTVVDEAGNPLFTEADIDALQTKSAIALDRVFDAAIRLNKLRKDDMDELEKNYESGRRGSLPTA